MRNNIVLVSDDENNAKDIASKLLFLRQNDAVTVVDYAKVLTMTDFSSVDVALVHQTTSKERTLDLLKFFKKFTDLKILLLITSNDSEFVLECYENGIDDFCIFDSYSEELVVRIVQLLKQNSLNLAYSRDRKLLEQFKIVDEYSKFYSYDYAKLVVENAIDYNLLKKGAFVAISPVGNQSFDNSINVIKMLVRAEDIITLGENKNLYIFLPDVNLNGAISVFFKLQECFSDFEIRAGITELGKNFVQMEREALQALVQAISTEAQYVIYEKQDIAIDEWLVNEQPRNYKLFRQIYNKKLEDVIVPVFYRLQQAWENKIFGTEIVQYILDNECIFELKNKNQSSRLKFIYSGFAKVDIQIIHDGLDSPENEEYQLSLTKLTQNELTQILEKFILDFRGEYVKY